MKATLQQILRCPMCRGHLESRSFDGPNNRSQIDTGVLICRSCHLWYPIEESVPILLVFPTALHRRFQNDHPEIQREFAEYSIPNGLPERGEESVQQTFTEEWASVADDERLSFTYTFEDLVQLNKQVWLKWLRQPESIKSILNVGVGLGRETKALSVIAPDAEVVAVDLNLAVIGKAKELTTAAPRTHVVVASLFHMPFDEGQFDLVYSQGVIHHTYSTHEAFQSVAAMVRQGGHLFIWVYGLDDHLAVGGLAGVVSRTGRIAEEITRPVVSALPRFLRNAFFKTASSGLHFLVRTRVRHREAWHFANTEHALRDWLSPRFAHRHSYNEVVAWFEQSGFKVIDVQSPDAYRKLFGKRLWGVGLTGQRDENVFSSQAAAGPGNSGTP